METEKVEKRWAVEAIGHEGVVTIKVVTPGGTLGIPMGVEDACRVVDAIMAEIKRASGDLEAKATWAGVDRAALFPEGVK